MMVVWVLTSIRNSAALELTTSLKMAMVEMESDLTTAWPLPYVNMSCDPVNALTKYSVMLSSEPEESVTGRGGTSGRHEFTWCVVGCAYVSVGRWVCVRA